LIAVTFFVFTAVASGPAGDHLRIHGNSLFLQSDAAGERPILTDPEGIGAVSASPEGGLLAYTRPFRGSEKPSAVVVVRRDGSVVRMIRITADLGINAVLQLGWLDAHRVWLEGHGTPSSGIFYVWDVRTGERVDERWGSWFAPSPDGRVIAQVEHIPHGAPLSPNIVIDGKPIYAAEGASTHIAHLVWSSDGAALAFVECDSKGAESVVAIRPTGEVLKRVAAAGRVSELTWRDADTLKINEGGKSREVRLSR